MALYLLMFSEPFINSSPYPEYQKHTTESYLGSQSTGENRHTEAHLEPASVVPSWEYGVWEREAKAGTFIVNLDAQSSFLGKCHSFFPRVCFVNTNFLCKYPGWLASNFSNSRPEDLACPRTWKLNDCPWELWCKQLYRKRHRRHIWEETASGEKLKPASVTSVSRIWTR